MKNNKSIRSVCGLLIMILFLSVPLLAGDTEAVFSSAYADTKAPTENLAKSRSTMATTPPSITTPVSITAAKVAPISKQSYGGKSRKPSVKLTYSGKVLVQGKDYKLSYKNNKNPGTATVKVDGIGDYYGTRSIKFKIIIKAPVKVKVKKNNKKITVSWKKGSAVSGYKVYFASNSKFTKKKKVRTLKSNKKLKYSIDTPVIKRTYYIKVRAYKKIKGKTYYSKASTVKKLKTKNLKWIKVDLSKQKVYLKKGKKTVKKYVVSTGKAKTPTIRGTFYIYNKNPKHDMIGRYNPEKGGPDYIQKDVLWATYFKGGYAFHAAYWHNNFGHPMSHGCVNMRTKQAKYLYKWAPIGTKVVVQR